MEEKNGLDGAVDRDACIWGESETLDLVPVAAGSSDPEDEVSVTSDEDLEELDAVIDPEFTEVDGWDVEAFALAEDDDEDDDDHDEEFDDDETEILMLHELGIDLDAPDGEPGFDLALAIEPDEPAESEDGVAA